MSDVIDDHPVIFEP